MTSQNNNRNNNNNNQNNERTSNNRRKHNSPKPTTEVLSQTSAQKLAARRKLFHFKKVNPAKIKGTLIFILGIIGAALATYFFQDNFVLLIISAVIAIVFVTAALLIVNIDKLKTQTESGS